MSLGEWEKAEILLRKLLETDTESATVALYQLSQVCPHIIPFASCFLVITNYVMCRWRWNRTRARTPW